MHIDQTGLAAGLAKVNQLCNSYHWVTEGRGPYAWNDDRYKEEMGNMLKNVSDTATTALNTSGSIAHSVCCEKEIRNVTMEDIGYIKQSEHKKVINDYEELIASRNLLVKEIDVILNGDDAAEQASLCDLIGEIRELKVNQSTELIETQREYIQLLGDEIGEMIGLATMHGWKSSRYKKGEELRERIEELSNNSNG